MYGIFVSPKHEVLRAASDDDRSMFIAQNWRELTQDEITAAGMAGYEKYVSPLTATVNPGGTITFTPPDAGEQLAPTPPVIITSDNITIADADFLLAASTAGDKTAAWLIAKLEL